MRGMHCTVCDWSVRIAEGYTQTEIDALAIEHFVATGHSVEADGDAGSAADRSGAPPFS